MDFLTRAYELQEETIANRRHIHQHAETGLDLPETVAFVKDKLTESGSHRLRPRRYRHIRKGQPGFTAAGGHGWSSDPGGQWRKFLMYHRSDARLRP